MEPAPVQDRRQVRAAILKIPGPLKAALNKLKPIINAKNDKGYIFLNNKFRQLSRSQFSSFVSWVFRKYASKKWTQNTIRAIKVSSVWKPSIENPLQLAKDMGHNIKDFSKYFNGFVKILKVFVEISKILVRNLEDYCKNFNDFGQNLEYFVQNIFECDAPIARLKMHRKDGGGK